MTANKKNIILGIDPGFATMGYAVLEKIQNQLKTLTYGIISTPSILEFPERLKKIYTGINKIIKIYQPAVVSIEKIYFAKNTKTALQVGHARGVILLTCQLNNLSIKEFTPLQIKQATAAYGRAQKIQIQKMMQLILKLPELPQPDDAADALALAWLASQDL